MQFCCCCKIISLRNYSAMSQLVDCCSLQTNNFTLHLSFLYLFIGINLNNESQLSILTLERDTLLTKLLEATTHADSLKDLLNSLSKELHDITKHNAHLKVYIIITLFTMIAW